MNPEMSRPDEDKFLREKLVEYFSLRADSLQKLAGAPREKQEEIMDSPVAKRALNDWIARKLEGGMSRVEVHNELGDICNEAGLFDEAQRQYKNAIDLAVREGKTEIIPTYE